MGKGRRTAFKKFERECDREVALYLQLKPFTLVLGKGKRTRLKSSKGIIQEMEKTSFFYRGTRGAFGGGNKIVHRPEKRPG